MVNAKRQATFRAIGVKILLTRATTYANSDYLYCSKFSVKIMQKNILPKVVQCPSKDDCLATRSLLMTRSFEKAAKNSNNSPKDWRNQL